MSRAEARDFDDNQLIKEQSEPIDIQMDATLVDYNKFLSDSQNELKVSPEPLAYLKHRGISIETARQLGLGYNPRWSSPKPVMVGSNPPTSKCLIFPTSRTSYIVLNIDQTALDNYRMVNMRSTDVFNKKSLHGNAPVYIVLSVLDALSICEVGGEACALGSANGVNRLLGLFDNERPTVPLLLSLNNDEAGKNAQKKLKDELKERKIAFTEVDISGGVKTPNAHLMQKRSVFKSVINSEKVITFRAELDVSRAAYLETSSKYRLNAFMAEIAERAYIPVISTGFAKLDAALGGGLHPGMYIIGAISSIGKTTFIIQSADQIAQNGHDVIIISLEMSRFELMAKSISRHTYYNSGGDKRNAKTTRDIMGGKWRINSSKERELVERSIKDYYEYSHRIYIYEGVGNVGMPEIRNIVEKHIQLTGNLPVVIIDYLQIIAPHNERASDKQIVDRAVLDLKKLSRDKNIPIIAISSFNRDNYNSPVNMASFKESGAVEYSSDILLGMQFAGMDELAKSSEKRSEMTSNIEDKKRADPRKIELKILKNRNGQIGVRLSYDYLPKFNTFIETDEPVSGKLSGELRKL